ncbi:MAG: ABC transporter permease [Acidobacteria bacterium]|nr:ABC transporter permease [Acidobacteriota bacterium]
MGTLLQDLRYGFRMLVRAPSITCLAILTLGIGIGANTALFSVFKAVLLDPLPYEDPDRTLMVWGENPELGWTFGTFSTAEYLVYREENRSLDMLAAYEAMSFNFADAGGPEHIAGVLATADVLPVLGFHAERGRLFGVQEDVPGNDRVVLFSHALWKSRFGGDAGILGRSVRLRRSPRMAQERGPEESADSYTVLGVLPPNFRLPTLNPDVVVPRAIAPGQRSALGNSLQVMARLRPGVTAKQAHDDLERVNRLLKGRYPEIGATRLRLVSLRDDEVGDLRLTLVVLLSSVGFVLLIGCANVANFVLGRASEREREIAVRSALGAGRSRLVRQLLTESLMLSCFGGVLGVLAAFWGLPILIALGPEGTMRSRSVDLDPGVLAFTLAVSVLAGLGSGIIPALRASRPDLNESLKEGARGLSGSARSHRTSRVLVGAEVALAVAVVIGAGLIAKSFLRLRDVDLGFDPGHVLTAQVTLPQSVYPNRPQRAAFYRQALERIRSHPDVVAAAVTTELPLVGTDAGVFFTVEGKPVPEEAAIPSVSVRFVSPEFFKAMGIPIVRGRSFESGENVAPAAIISESMAARYWADEDPVGKRIHLNRPQDPGSFLSVVGVVRNVRHRGPRQEQLPTLYLPLFGSSAMTFVVRTTGDPVALAPVLRTAVTSIDAEQPVFDVLPMEKRLSDVLAPERFRALLLALFAGAALILAAGGIYGVLSSQVRRHAREIGIRLALGAQKRDVLGWVLRQGMVPVGCGLVAGCAGALLLTRLFSGLLYGVKPHDAATFVQIAALLTVVALIACWIPARRAARVDPMVALRNE